MPGAWSSAATFRHGGRRASKREDSRAHGGRRNSSTRGAWGWFFCTPGRTRPKHQLDQFRREGQTSRSPLQGDIVVECGDAASESCLPSLDMRSSTAAGGLVPTGKASTAKKTNFNQLPLRFCLTEEMDLEPNCKKTSTPYASIDSSSVWRLLAAPYCWRVVDTNPGKIGLLTQAVHEVTSAPARFWDRGASWFVARSYGLGQLVKSCSVFSHEIGWFFVTGLF